MNKNLGPDDYDDEGFRACIKCGSRKTLCGGHALDELYIKCLDCSHNVGAGEFYPMLAEWNKRESDVDKPTSFTT